MYVSWGRAGSMHSSASGSEDPQQPVVTFGDGVLPPAAAGEEVHAVRSVPHQC